MAEHCRRCDPLDREIALEVDIDLQAMRWRCPDCGREGELVDSQEFANAVMEAFSNETVIAYFPGK